MSAFDPDKFGVDYWLPAGQMRDKDYRLWMAEKLAEFTSELSEVIEHYHPEPIIQPEAIQRILDSGITADDPVPTGILNSHLIQDELKRHNRKDRRD